MKKGILIIAMGLLCAVSIKAKGYDLPKVVEDTVVIEVGGSKIIIVVNSAEDLKKLEKFDVNQMIMDLNANLESDSLKSGNLTMTDSAGAAYEKEDGLSYYGEGARTNENAPVADGNWESEDNDWDNYEYADTNKDKPVRRTYGSFDLELGMNNWLEDGAFPDANGELHSIKPWGSWYVALGHSNHTHISGPLSLDWGANVSWYNWKLQNTDVRIIQTETETIFEIDPVLEGDKSKLTATYINVNLVPVFDFGSKKSNKGGGYWGNKYDRKGFRVGFGGYAGYRLNSWSKFVYQDDGKQKDRDYDNFFLNNFRYGVRGILGYKAMDLFVNYDLNTVFSDGRGPKLNGMSFGIIL
ncbi:MAG: hypothetical protein OCD76_11275 [Reichenbachiella sp.]